MMTFKCKMCGGDLSFEPGASVAECPYCGTNQTLPRLDDGKRANLYDRANHFRRQNEYDKAMAIYEQILAEDRADAEAYWSLVLCRYGIEYVEDPATHKRVPTVNRVQYASILADEDYKSALGHADAAQRAIYEAEASAIAEIQKGILDISQKEEPFDVFICYKETDANGRRTPDSVLAQDIYYQLVNEGYKVFFSRITLEDKIGRQYEPYIFAALNSAKVMLVVGTKPEFFNAVWVRNEWSRFLALAKKDRSRLIIPCYREMDPYDLPEELSLFQAQDMSKIGFLQDLERGVKKILSKGKSLKPENQSSADERAIELINKSMNDELQKCQSDISKVEQEIGRIQAEFSQRKKSQQKKTQAEFDNALARLQNQLKGLKTRYESTEARFLLIRDNPSERKKWVDAFLGREEQYREARKMMERKEYAKARDAFRRLDGLYDSDIKANECDAAFKEENYQLAASLQKQRKWTEAARLFDDLKDYKDSASRAGQCKKKGGGVFTANPVINKASVGSGNVISTPAMAGAYKSPKKKPGCLGRLLRLILILFIISGILYAIGYRAPSNETKMKMASDARESVEQYPMLVAPDESYIIERLSRVEDIAAIGAATVDNDPNHELNKQGGYIAEIFFTSSLVSEDAADKSAYEVVKGGTEGGGSIEVYRTVEDAIKREEYLSNFSGGILNSGSHRVAGTCVIRISPKLTSALQAKLEEEIIAALSAANGNGSSDT